MAWTIPARKDGNEIRLLCLEATELHTHWHAREQNSICALTFVNALTFNIYFLHEIDLS
jgi:hypothetical protein